MTHLGGMALAWLEVAGRGSIVQAAILDVDEPLLLRVCYPQVWHEVLSARAWAAFGILVFRNKNIFQSSKLGNKDARNSYIEFPARSNTDMGEHEDTGIRPVIRDEKLVGLVICGLSWPLRAPIPVEKAKRLLEAASLVAEFLDMERLRTASSRKEWNESELACFLAERSIAQRLFLTLLAEKGIIREEEVLNELRWNIGLLEYGRREVAVVAASINLEVRKLGKEPLLRVRREISDSGLMRLYELNPKYRDAIRRILRSRQ